MTTTTLAELVAPCGVEEFLGAVWGRRMRVFRGDSARTAGLLPWPALNELLRRHRLEVPRLRLARGGERIAEEEYTVEVPLRRGGSYRRIAVDALTRQLGGGATLVVDSIDELHAPIDALAGDLERTLRERVQVNCYTGFGALHGFDTHWDDHDVLAVQVHGRKRWRVFGPTRPYPQRRDVRRPEPPDGEPVEDFVLTAGDVLHVPRGWWHDATALDEPSLHLTFGVTAATGVDLVGWLADELRHVEAARRDLPRFGNSGAGERRVKELADALAGRLAEPDLLDRFFAVRDAQAPPRGYASLPWAVYGELPDGPGARVRLVAPRVVLTARDGAVELAADDRRATFAAPAEPVLRALLDGGGHALAELYRAAPELAAAAVDGLIGELVKLGFAAVDEA